MTRKDILKKYGFSWMSNVNLKEELSEQAAAEFEDLIRTLAEHNREPAPPETGWKKQTGDKNGEDNSICNHSCNYNAALPVMLCVGERNYGITNLGESCGRIRENKRSA